MHDPTGPWVMGQRWHDLLFAHWPVDAAALRAKIPAPLELELRDGEAWLGIVPFRMTGVRVRGLPGLSTPELNVRTYVHCGGVPGVWFLSLDAASGLAVAAARVLFGLPYRRARMQVTTRDSWIHHESRRKDAEFVARYRPTGPAEHARPGTLEQWLTDRLRLFAVRRGRVYATEVRHPPWPLQPAEAEIEANTMAAIHGLALPDRAPLLHFSRFLDVRVWRPRRFALEGGSRRMLDVDEGTFEVPEDFDEPLPD